MSRSIDAREPDRGKPLPHWLAPSSARTSACTADVASVSGDIVRQAERAIAGVPLGPPGSGFSAQAAAVRSLVAALSKASIVLRCEVSRTTRGAVAALHERSVLLHHKLKLFAEMWAPALRGKYEQVKTLATALPLTLRQYREAGTRLIPLGNRFTAKLCVGCGAAALALSAVLAFLPGQIDSRASPSSDFPGTPAWPPHASAAPQAPEERPAAGPGVEFSEANIRYCTFQQIRLEALGPVTEGADLVVFNALVEDWNARCTRYRYKAADKDAIDGEAAARRALLEVEGRALMNGWRRKIVTTVQQHPVSAAPDAGEGVPVIPASVRYGIERLPLLITTGRAVSDEPDGGLALKMPALALLRADVAMRVQRRLNDLGYTINPADGTWGTMSRNALRRFKAANGLLGNDAFDAETVTRLFSTSAVTAALAGRPDEETGAVETAYPPPPAAGMNPLNRADRQRIQQRLAELGYYTARGEGSWGAASRSALRSFKVMNGLPDDDEWNAIAEAALFDEQAARAMDVGVASPRIPVASRAPVPLPPKRPAPPRVSAKAGDPAPSALIDAPRPPGLIPGSSARASR